MTSVEDHLRRLHNAAKDIGLLDDRAAIAETALRHLSEAFEVPAVVLSESSEPGTYSAWSAGVSRALPPLRALTPHEACIVGVGHGLRLEDLGCDDPEQVEAYRAFLFAAGEVSGRLVCLVGVERTGLDMEDLELLCGLASVAAACTERARMRDRALLEHARRLRLSRYFSPTVADMLAASEPGGMVASRTEATVLFCDIRGFTALAEDRDPTAVLAILNAFYRMATAAVFEAGGMIDKLLGDGLLAVFGGPIPLDDHARHAIECAIKVVSGVARLDLSAYGIDRLRVGAGLHTGVVLSGDLGTDEYADFTVLGATVNLASRIEALTKKYGAEILLTEATRARVSPLPPTQSLGEIPIRGLSHPVLVHRLLLVEGAHVPGSK